MKANVRFKRISKETGFIGGLRDLERLLDNLDLDNFRVKDHVFINIGDEYLVVDLKNNELVKTLEDTNYLVADFCDDNYDLEQVLRSEVEEIEIIDIVLTI